MKPERNQQIDRIFQAALDRSAAERAAFLNEACAGDEVLKREVEALIESDERASSFIEWPALEVAPELIAVEQSRSIVGKTIGPYEINSQLGSGGMGEVYLAQDTRLGRKVALKLLDSHSIGDSQLRSRFLREARLASVLDHPNICAIHEVGEASGHLFIAMQYVEGETLKGLIDGNPLSLDSLLSISLQVAGALATAHAERIVHRDIKSSNIIITPKGQAKVLDFGLAKLLEKEKAQVGTELTRTGAVIGTPSYMAPEQARGARADHRSDIFSFGAVMYEMATGRVPFKGRSLTETMNAVINEPHTPVLELNKEVPPGLSAVIDRALAKEPADRYQSIEEMIADLRRVVRQTSGLLELLNSSDAPDGVIVPYVPLRRRTLLSLFSRWPRNSARNVSLALIAGLSLIGLALVVGYLSMRRPAPPTPIRTIAVLPFRPLVADNRDESLEMGMADTLITRLSNLRQVITRPMSAVRKYAGLEQDPVAAGREQRVDAVLDGSIQKSSEKIRVTVRLVSAADGSQLWAERFDEKFTDIFTVQDSISERVAAALAVRLTGEEKELLTKRNTESTEAYQLYLKGRYYWNKFTDDGFGKGIEYFKQALDRDPSYALAYVGLADIYISMDWYGQLSTKEASPLAKGTAMKALEIDDTLAEAHASLAVIKQYEWDWSGAEREFKRAIELNRNYAAVHQWYGVYLGCTGRIDEGIAEMKQAQELDPLSLAINAQAGLLLYMARRYDEAIGQCRKTLEFEPTCDEARFYLSWIYAQKGMHEEAIGEYEKLTERDNPDAIATLGYFYALSGKRSHARDVLNRLKQASRQRYVSPSFVAAIYGGLGDKDEAFEWLEKVYEEHDDSGAWLKIDPWFDPLRSDPRFDDLLRRMGLAQ